MLTFSLCGCSAVAHVSAELTSANDLRFAYCEPYSPSEIRVWEAKPSDWTDAKVVWRASGSTALAEGKAVTYGDAPSGYRTTTGPTSFDPAKSRFQVDFIDPTTTKTIPPTSGDFDGSKLVVDKWLNWNGQIVNHPCDG